MKPKSTLRHFLALAGSPLLAISSAHAGNNWDGGSPDPGGDSNITTQENWDGDVVANFGAQMFFGGNTRNAINNDRAAASNFAQFSFTNNGTAGKTNAFTLSGNSLTLTNNIVTTAVTTGPAITDEISLKMILSATRTINTGTNHNLNVTGIISESGGTNRGITKSGAGTLTLSNLDNTFTGQSAITGGVLEVTKMADAGQSSSIGSSATVSGNFNLDNGSTLRYIGDGHSTNRIARFGSAGTGIVTFDASGTGALNFTNTGVFTGTTNDGATKTLNLIGSNTDNNTLAIKVTNIPAVTTGIMAVTKNGVGTWVLTNDNTYSGGTTVTNGRLLVNNSTGSGTGSGAVTVGTNGTLGGNGTIAGAVTVDGALKPGNSSGLLTVGSLVLNASSSTTLEINGTSRGAVSNGYDALGLNTGGSIALGGALSIVFGNLAAFAASTEFDLFSFDTTSTGDFSSVTSTGFYTGTWSKAGDIWSLTDAGQTLNFSEVTGNLVVIPEPSAALLGGLGLLLLFRRRR